MDKTTETLLRKYELLMTLGPTMRARSSTIYRSAYEASLVRKEALLNAKKELELILQLCKEIRNA